MDFYVYLDSDTNPANGAHFVSSLLNQPIGPLEQFNAFPVNIVLGEVGDVLIAVVNRTCTGPSPLTYPAALDTTNSQLRSWAGVYVAPATTVPNPPPNPPILPPPVFGLIDSFGYPGNWMLRGVGKPGVEGATPTPIPTASVTNTPTITPTPTNTTTPTSSPTPTSTSVLPEIELTPDTFNKTHLAPQISTDTLTIQNVGSLTLTWAITESNRAIATQPSGIATPILPSEGGDCSVLNDITWLSMTPVNGNTTSGDSTPVTLTFDSTTLANGFYSGTLCIASNDADTPLVAVPVTLYVGLPTAIKMDVFTVPGIKVNGINGVIGLLLLAGAVLVLRRK